MKDSKGQEKSASNTAKDKRKERVRGIRKQIKKYIKRSKGQKKEHIKYSERQEKEYIKYKSAIKERRRNGTLAHVKIVSKKTYFIVKEALRENKRALKLTPSVRSREVIRAFADTGLNRKQLVILAAYMAGSNKTSYSEIIKDSALKKKVENQINKFNRMSRADQNALIHDYLIANYNYDLQYFGDTF